MKSYIPTLLCALFTCALFSQNVDIELFKNGFSNPVDLQNAGDDRLFVVEQGGRIKIIQADGTINPTPFLNISTLVSNASEQGLLGLAFHPDYANNGYFYVNYTKNNDDTRVARYSVDPADPDIALSGSESTILEIVQPFENHNGGDLEFGPDGYLYIGTGDGGSGGDPGNRAQQLTFLLGKMLRIDVDNPAPPLNYGIPADNPFVGDPSALDEIWAYGLRNPWRYSFDSANGDLWIGDVGQGDVEELDKAAIDAAGLNYGWRCYEGSQTYNTGGCPPSTDLTFPIGEYSSSPGSGNCSVTGGIVYRGTEFPILQGLYFFADVCSGLIGTIDPSGNLVDHGDFSGSWVGFGEDSNKILYIISHGGSIYRIVDTSIIGIEDFDAPVVTLVPNPASESVLLQISNDVINSIFIADMKGSVLFEEENISISEKNIAINTLSRGIYLVSVLTDSGKKLVKKLVIE